MHGVQARIGGRDLKHWLPYLTGLAMVLLVAFFLPAGQLPGFGLGVLAGCVESLVCWYAMGGDGR
jgi:hypothetical protein